jgi:hypothetical protein
MMKMMKRMKRMRIKMKMMKMMKMKIFFLRIGLLASHSSGASGRSRGKK